VSRQRRTGSRCERLSRQELRQHLESQQFDDRLQGRFFMRVHFDVSDPNTDLERLRYRFGPVAQAYRISWALSDASTPTRTLIMVSRFGQCRNDLLFRRHTRTLNIEIPAIFKGARPYEQAYQRGVKLVGATAHYVTPDLDEGQIIEPDVAWVDHSLNPGELVTVGRDVEAQVLAHAVKWHSESRVMVDGHRTVVFR
jgi:formyltetrahydrofolate hydrolase